MSVEDLQPSLAEGGEAAMKALVEKAKTAPGSVFEPETLSALAQLAKANFPAWVNLRARLKSETREVPMSELDKRLTASGVDPSDGDDGFPGGRLKFDEIEPWDERVDGAKLLAELSSAIGAYVIMDPTQRVAVALWAVFTHAHDSFLGAPLLIILSPTKRCGKTRLQEILAKLTPRPLTMSGVSAAALARVVEEHRPTVFIDEYDAAARGNRDMAESLRGQLNSSFNRNSAHVLKSVPLPGGGWEVRKFSTWAPTCIAGIGQVPDTVADRSVIIRLARKLGKGVVVKTVINGLVFDGATKDSMQKAVRDAVIAFMAATAEAQAEATREAQRAGIAYARAMDPQSYRGRKPSFDREQPDAIRDMLAQDVRPSAISKATGVSRQTDRIRDDPTKAEAILLEWAP